MSKVWRNLNDDLSNVLRAAEEDVLEIVALAAKDCDYAMIDKARAVAERLRSLNPDLSLASAVKVEQEERKPAGSKKVRRKSKSGAKKKPTGSYPKFEVANGSLFKIGWSKRKGTEYTHRVPLNRAKEVIEVLDKLSEKVSGIISTEKILESEEFMMAQVPSYQVYLVLALLRQEKIIVASGRDGYSLPSGIYSQADSLFHTLEVQ